MNYLSPAQGINSAQLSPGMEDPQTVGEGSQGPKVLEGSGRGCYKE